MALFNFALKPIDQCACPLDSVGRKRLAWFWLTDSWYYIDCGGVKLFEQRQTGCYLDYYFVRFLEDFFEILPAIAAPLPSDIFSLIDTSAKRQALFSQQADWYAQIDDPTDQQESMYDNIGTLLWANKLDTGFLRYRADCRFYRLGDTMRIMYDFRDTNAYGMPPWSAGCGQYDISWRDFMGEVEDLLVRFFHDMDQQVQDAGELLMNDDTYSDETFNDRTREAGRDHLVTENDQRKADFWGILNDVTHGNVTSPDWGAIRSGVDALKSFRDGSGTP